LVSGGGVICYLCQGVEWIWWTVCGCFCACVVDGMASLCYCSVCPSGNTTCELKPNGQCFAAVELEGDDWVLSHGCLAPVDDEGGIILQVRSAFCICWISISREWIYVCPATAAGACRRALCPGSHLSC